MKTEIRNVIRRLCDNCGRRLEFGGIDFEALYLTCPTCGKIYVFKRKD